MRLYRNFFSQNPRIVARELLGRTLVCGTKKLVITEVEAYLGPEDLASHARFGPTRSKRIMWGEGGLIYVYLIYGMYEMTNIITGKIDEPGAVLLRAGLSLETKETYQGPGKVSNYLGIDRTMTGLDLVTSPSLFVENKGIKPKKMMVTPRIGVNYAGVWAKKKLRYVAEF